MKTKRFLVLLAVMLLLFTGVAAAAADTTGESSGTLMSDDGNYHYYSRMIDVTGSLSDDERATLRDELFDFIDDVKIDLQIYIIGSVEKNGCASIAEFAESNYDDPKYPAGYGADRQALIYVYEKEKDHSEIISFCTADAAPDRFEVMKAKYSADYYIRSGNVYDGCRGLIDRIRHSLNYTHSIRPAIRDMMTASEFVPFHNESVSRLQDYSNLLTASQQEAMEERLQHIRKDYQMDIVVLTGPNSDGKVWEDFADDFYDYVGFGYGDDYDGMILFVDMDPSDRGYTITTYGNRARSLYDDKIENLYDEMLDSFKEGAYYEGISIYVDFAVRTINRKEPAKSFGGIARADIKDSTDASRVIDEDGLLKDSVRNKLEKQIEKIRKEYKTDVLVLAVRDTGDYYPEDYLKNYFRFNGYGEGSKKSGVGVILVDPDTQKAQAEVVVFGGASGKFNASATERLRSMTQSALGSSHFDSAATKFVNKTQFRLKWGHYPLKTSTTVFIFIVVFLVVSIIAAIKKGANKSISKAVTATEYVVPGSFRISRLDERFINSKVTKTRKPEPSSSRSGGGGGGHYSSSGRSHGGGGGRHF